MRYLTSNGQRLPMDENYVGPLKQSPPSVLANGVARSRFQSDGYLLLREALDEDVVFDMRHRYLSMFGKGFVKDGDTRRGIFSGNHPEGLPAHGISGHPAFEFVRSEAFLRFADQPLFRRIAEVLLGSEVTRLKRTPLRHFIQGQTVASRAHIDRTYVANEPDEFVTLWVPLGDCPLESGGLTYLEKSHLPGAINQKLRDTAPTDRPNDQRPITHDLKWMSDQTDSRWLMTEYKAGDIIAHSPDIVHASLDATGEIMRISVDIRFAKASAKGDSRWQDHWSADDGY